MIWNKSSKTEELVIGRPSEETKDHLRTEMELVQYSPLDIPHPRNIDKYQDKNPSLMTTMGITTTASLLWTNSMP
ncbi:unnamed protein product [Rhodiola kirilowii]